MSTYTAQGLCDYAIRQLGRPYWNGTFGQIASKSLYDQNKNRCNYGPWKGDYEKAVGQKVHDCNGLVKGYLWCDGPDSGNYTYKKVTGEDLTVEEFYRNSTARGNLDSIPKVRGILVFTSSFSHMGVYIGDGWVVEAKGHAWGVIQTKLYERNWALWCKSQYIDYTGAEESSMAGNSSIATFQSWINSYLPMKYLGTKLSVDGVYGAKTKTAAIKSLQYWLNTQYGEKLDIDGGFGAKTTAACRSVSNGDAGPGVYLLQGMLYCKGYDPKGVDGSFGVNGGRGCIDALRKFQDDSDIAECGTKTFKKLFS